MTPPLATGFELRGEATPARLLIRRLWQERELMSTLAKRDFLVRYRRATFGLFWVVGLPLVQATMISIIFSRLLRFETGLPYAIFVLSGTLSWSFFSASVLAATTSIVDGSDFATKIYFPRAVLPIVQVWSGIHGYLPAMVILVAAGAAWKAHLGFGLLYLAPAIVLTVAMTAGFALVFAALHVYFRDMRYIVQAAMLPWFWASGVFFPLSALKSLAPWLQVNPAVGMLDLYRVALGAPPASWTRHVMISVLWMVVLYAIALPLYRRYDRVFVDLL